jgi:hypothetical protein
MKFRVTAVILIFLATSGCGTNSSTGISPTAPRAYNGSASVGDFLNITLDPVAHTIAYTNHSNGDTGTVPYTVNPDGTYTLTDPAGNLVAAYEVPNYAMLIQAAKTGPNHDQPSLITAVESGQISVATWASHSYNYMQFRTAAGGLEIGSVVLDGQGTANVQGYWPYGAVNGSGSAFNQGTFDSSQFINDPSGTFLKLVDGSEFDYVFGTPNGVFAVDTPNGAILGLQKAASKNFDPTFAGTYKAIFYQKTGANTGVGNIETGTPSLGTSTMAIGSTGQITVQDSTGATILQAQLIPVADAAYLVGPNELSDSCFGLFTFRVTTANSQRDVFVTFQDRSVLFSSFSTSLPWQSSNTYDYLYGVGLK